MMKVYLSNRLRSCLSLAITATVLLSFTGCKKNSEDQNPVKASEWISKADWATARTITLTFKENPYAIETSAPLVLNAGQPYILKLVNPVGNTEKHYFATEGSNDFFKAIATRKAQTPDAEYKAPFFEAFELLVPTTSDRILELFFVPVKTGKYHILCTIAGHAAGGMHTDIEIKGDPALQLDLEVDPAFKTELAKDPRKSGSHAAWITRMDKTVTINEAPSYSFNPGTLKVQQNKAYKIRLAQQAGNKEKHYYTAEGFYKTVVTRKLQDSHAEIKPYYLKAVELFKGNTFTEMFVIPTATGSFPVKCTISGHEHAGMKGDIIVEP